jgi:microcystin-dependent protein
MALIAGVQYSGVPPGTIIPCGQGIIISSMTTTGNPTTVTTSSNHNLINGDIIAISGTATTPTSTLGIFTVANVLSVTTFTIAVNVTGGTTSGSVSKIPPRTILCDGTSYSTTGPLASLFSVIGYSYGGSGSNFNVPDFRGRFLRGVDINAGTDPDKAARLSMNAGGSSGNNIGSIQGSQFGGHTHVQNANVSVGQSGIANGQVLGLGNGGTQVSGATNYSTASTGGNETRPVNAYVNYCIAF